MVEGTERSFYCETPHEDLERPAAGFEDVGTEVMLGLRLAMAAVKRRRHQEKWDPVRFSQELDLASNIFIRYLEGLEKIDHRPTISVVTNPVPIRRLGKLLGGQTALYSSNAMLRPKETYPINYWGRHWVTPEFREEDYLSDSTSQEQWYVGFVTGDHSYMEGYALSLNHLLHAAKKNLYLGSVPNSMPEINPGLDYPD
jgi:hypothetical protein